MNVPSQIMAIRYKRASELEAFARILDKLGICVRSDLIYDAATILRDKTKGFHTPDTTDYACWGYSIEDLKIYLSELPKRHIRPSSIHSMQIEIDIHLLCNDQHWKDQKDPLLDLNFRARIIGVDSKARYSFGYHVDRHDDSQITEEIHPVYHLQYDPLANDDLELGSTLYLDTPRIMHVPVDLILGIDLVLSNFAPSTWQSLRDDEDYHPLYCKYQNYLWKPYVHTWASHWSYQPQKNNWNLPLSICPYLINE